MPMLLQLYHVKKTEHHYWTPRRHRLFHPSTQTIGRLTNIASHLNLQISFTIMSRCWLATPISSLSCGLHCWQATMSLHPSPTTRVQDLYNTIDATPIGGVPWQSATLSYDGPCHDWPLLWMESEYTIWFRDPCLLFRNLLENPEFAGSFNYTPYQQYDNKGKRRYEHFMSGNWAWKQAVSKVFSSFYFIDKCPEYHRW